MNIEPRHPTDMDMESIAWESGPKIETESGIDTLIFEKHEVALAWQKIECLLGEALEGVTGEISDELIQAEKEKIMKEWQAMAEEEVSKTPDINLYFYRLEIEKWMTDYLEQKRAAKNVEREIVEELKEVGLDVTPELLGEYLFNLRTNNQHSNTGKVTAIQKEGYFVVSCENEDDYEYFYWGTERPTKKVKDGSAGTYHRSFTLSSTLRVQCLLINQTESQSEYDDVVTHERQHFFNHSVFRLFNAIEDRNELAPVSSYPDLSRAWDDTSYLLRYIKDEALAHLRGGSSAGASTTSMFISDAYKHLRDMFNEVEQEEIKRMLSRIRNELGEFFQFFSDKKARPLLVNQLLDVPLHEFAEYIQRATHAYRTMLSLDVLVIEGLAANKAAKPADIFFPSSLREAGEALLANSLRARELFFPSDPNHTNRQGLRTNQQERQKLEVSYTNILKRDFGETKILVTGGNFANLAREETYTQLGKSKEDAGALFRESIRHVLDGSGSKLHPNDIWRAHAYIDSLVNLREDIDSIFKEFLGKDYSVVLDKSPYFAPPYDFNVLVQYEGNDRKRYDCFSFVLRYHIGKEV